MCNQRAIFKIEIFLNYQWTNLDFDVLIYLLVIWLRYECLKSDECFDVLKIIQNEGKMAYKYEWRAWYEKRLTWNKFYFDVSLFLMF